MNFLNYFDLLNTLTCNSVNQFFAFKNMSC
jgi:hypothetical protein